MRKLRIYYQTFFLLLFIALALLADQARLRGFPVTLLLDSSALNGLGTLLASGNVAYTLWIGFAFLAAAFLLGRFFCGWVCPMGAILQFTSWLTRPRAPAAAIKANRHHPAQGVKYAILVILLACAALGSLQIGLLDPIALLTRTTATFLAPAVSGIHLSSGAVERAFPAAPLIATLFIAIVALNAIQPRFFCRYLCPLGALLGVAARFAPGAIVRNERTCTRCNHCTRVCPAACSPETKTRVSECYLCWNCIAACPEDALSWRPRASRSHLQLEPDLSRRRFIGAAAVGALAFPALRLSGATGTHGHPHRIRPPGSLAEEDFLERCLKCGECMKVCPTGVLQPAVSEAGWEGFWSPVLDMRQGYCELNCTLCGSVCPTGAIQRLPVARKTGADGRPPVHIGTAFIDTDRCLPWSFNRPCLVCQEVCPVSPKAVYHVTGIARGHEGDTNLRRPQVDPELCIGCGICEHECPVRDLAAIRVTSTGETRSRSGGFLLGKAGG